MESLIYSVRFWVCFSKLINDTLRDRNSVAPSKMSKFQIGKQTIERLSYSRTCNKYIIIIYFVSIFVCIIHHTSLIEGFFPELDPFTWHRPTYCTYRIFFITQLRFFGGQCRFIYNDTHRELLHFDWLSAIRVCYDRCDTSHFKFFRSQRVKAISIPAVSREFLEFSCFPVLTCHGRDLRESRVFGVFFREFWTKLAVDFLRLPEKICRFYAPRVKRKSHSRRTRGEDNGQVT